jgi:hypothetical protein
VSLRVVPVVLAGAAVRLEPLRQEHASGLYNRGRSAADWAYMPRACFVDLADTRQWIEEALAAPAQLPFAIVETGKDRVVGSTRYLNIRPEHRSLEIGWTWLGQDYCCCPTPLNASVVCGWSSRPMRGTNARSAHWRGLVPRERASCAIT